MTSRRVSGPASSRCSCCRCGPSVGVAVAVAPHPVHQLCRTPINANSSSVRSVWAVAGLLTAFAAVV
jgi:hypothetical protein